MEGDAAEKDENRKRSREGHKFSYDKQKVIN